MPCVEPPEGYVCIGLDRDFTPISFPVKDGAGIACAPLASKTGFLDILKTTIPKTAKTLEAASPHPLGDLRYKYFPKRYSPEIGTCCNDRAILGVRDCQPIIQTKFAAMTSSQFI